MAEEDKELMREVNEAVQRERMEQLWKRYGRQVLTGVALIIAISAGAIFWEGHQKTLKQERTAMLLKGQGFFTEERYADARDLFLKVASDAKGEAQLLASIWLAKSEMALGNMEGAWRIAGDVAEHKNANNRALIHYACIMQAMLPLDKGVNCLSNIKKNGPFFAIAQEISVAKTSAPVATILSALEGAVLSPTQQRRIDDYTAYSQSRQGNAQ